jgi:hypothetical protein
MASDSMEENKVDIPKTIKEILEEQARQENTHERV